MHGYWSRAARFSKYLEHSGNPRSCLPLTALRPINLLASNSHGELSRGRSRSSSSQGRLSAQQKDGHPSREREKARQASHDRKMKRWESTMSHEASIDHPEHYFDEKWTHTTGRMSDWKPPRDEPASQTASKAGRHSRRSQRSRRSYDESTAHSLSEAVVEGAQPPKGLDFETRRQYYAAELEKTLDGVAAEEGDDPQASSEIAVEAASGGASPSYQASQNEERRESSSNGLSTSESSEPFPSQGKGQQSRWRFFATCHPGLESAVAGELSGANIAAEDVSAGRAGVTFW